MRRSKQQWKKAQMLPSTMRLVLSFGEDIFFNGSEISPLGGLNWNGQVGRICISEQECLFSSKGVWAFPFVLGTRKALCHAHHHLSNSQILFSRLCGVTEKANPWCWQCCYQHKEDSDLLSPSPTVLCVWFRWTTGVPVRQNNQHLCKYLGKPSTVIVSVSFWLWMFLPNAIKKRNNVWYQGCYESNRKCWKRKGEWRGKVGKAAGNYLNESKAKLKGRWGVDFQGHTLLAWHSVRQKDKLHLKNFTRS